MLRVTPIYSSINRHHLFLGADWHLGLCAVALGLFVGISYVSPVGIAAGFLISAVSIWALRAAAKSDPLFREVYLRRRKYPAYLLAKSGRRMTWR